MRKFRNLVFKITLTKLKQSLKNSVSGEF